MKRLSHLVLIVITILSTVALQAQDKPKDYGIKSKKALDYYFEGQQQSQWRAYREAAKAYEDALAIEPEFAHARLHLGITAFLLEKYEPAIEQLTLARELRPDEFPALEFYLGQASFKAEEYADAAAALQIYLGEETGRRQDIAKAQDLLKHSLFAAQAIQNPVDFEPQNLGPAINTQYHEYLPYLTADNGKLLFTSRRPESIGGFQPTLRDFSEDFFYSIPGEGNSWVQAENLGEPINSDANEGAAAMSQDGRVIIFTACNRSDGVGNCDLYISYLNEEGWSKPRNLGPQVNGEGWDSQPCLSHDGKTLYFSSARQGGEGGRDLWYSTWDGRMWGPAQNLGSPVNSPGNEDSPFLHADGLTLYFSSDYHPGFGSQDLFVSYRQDNGPWADPINLGYPLNTSAEESNIFVATSGKQGFINSDREGGLGGSDLYSFQMPEEVRPQISTFVRGVVKDSITNVPVFAALQVIDVESGDTLRDIRSGRSDGKFLMSLPGGHEYAVYAKAPNYLFTSQHFALKDLDDETFFDLTILMKPLRQGMQIVLPNIFYETGSYELSSNSSAEIGALKEFLDRNPRIRIELQGHTDDVGGEADNQLLSQRRAESVKQALVALGINPSRLVATGYGETVPIADNETDSGRAENRRTEMKIVEIGG